VKSLAAMTYFSLNWREEFIIFHSQKTAQNINKDTKLLRVHN